jgi:ketosteroid isomerase-like protein
MFRKLLIVAVTVLVPAIAGAQQTTDSKAKQIEAMERALHAALQKGDINAFKANIADDAISMEGAGPMPIAEFLKMFGQFKITKHAIDQVKVNFLSDTAAIITYRWTGAGTMMGQPVPSPAWASTVYALRAGKWQAVFHQETIATPPPPAPKK